jgi:putative SOS response-associated peptidase YedK
MCNLYSVTIGQAAIIAFTRAMRDLTGNMPPLPGIFPDYAAPVVRNAPDRVRELAMLRWGMRSSQFALMQAAQKRAAKLEAKGQAVNFKQLLRMEPDSGTTNIRNVRSKHWQRWLGVEHRCVVPFTSFQRVQQSDGRRRLVRLGRHPPAGRVRRNLDDMDLRAQSERGRSYLRLVRLTHHGSE